MTKVDLVQTSVLTNEEMGDEIKEEDSDGQWWTAMDRGGGVFINGNNRSGWECYRIQRMIAHEEEKELLVQQSLKNEKVSQLPHHELMVYTEATNKDQRSTLSSTRESVEELTNSWPEKSFLENDESFSGAEDVEYVSSCIEDSSSEDEISSVSESENEEEEKEEEKDDEINEVEEKDEKDNQGGERDMEILRQHFLALLEKQPSSTTVKSKPQPQPKNPTAQTQLKKETTATPSKKANKNEEKEKSWKEKEKEWVTVPAVKLCTSATCTNLTRDINRYAQHHSQSIAFLQRKQNLRASLFKMLAQLWPGSSLHFFGSSSNGFGSDTSDVDLCALISSEGRTGKRQAVEFLRNMKRYMGRNMKHLQRVIFIDAKTPILKFYDSVNGCKCDLSVSNEMAIRNTHLLRTYAHVDDRVRPLVLAVKRWANARGINEACEGTLSSYAIVLMCIHFLQCGCSPPVLTSLQKLYPQYFRLDSSISLLEKFEPWRAIPCNTSRNKKSVGELFAGFFRYFCTKFSWETNVASVCESRVLDKSTYRKFKGRICVEDPLEYYNTARSVKTMYAYYLIRTEFQRAYKLTTDGVSFDQIVELKKEEAKARLDTKKGSQRENRSQEKENNQGKQTGEVRKEVTEGEGQGSDKKEGKLKTEVKGQSKEEKVNGFHTRKHEQVTGKRQDKVERKTGNAQATKEKGKVSQKEINRKNENQHQTPPQGVKSVGRGYQSQRNNMSSPKGRGAFLWNGRGMSVNSYAGTPSINWNLNAVNFGRGRGKNNSQITNHPFSFLNKTNEKHTMVNGSSTHNQQSSLVIPIDHFPGNKMFKSYQNMLELYNLSSGRTMPLYRCDKNNDGSFCGSVAFLSPHQWQKSYFTSKTVKVALARAAYDALKTIPLIKDVKSMGHFDERTCYSK